MLLEAMAKFTVARVPTGYETGLSVCGVRIWRGSTAIRPAVRGNGDR